MTTKLLKAFLISLFLISLSWGNSFFEMRCESRVQPTISQEAIFELVTSSLNITPYGGQYSNSFLDVVTDEAGDLSYINVSLYIPNTFGYDFYRLNIENNRDVTVLKDYQEPVAPKDENEPCYECPDPEVEAIIACPIDERTLQNFPICMSNVIKAYNFCKEAGLKTVLLREDGNWNDGATADGKETQQTVGNYLSCPKFKVYGRIGHGTRGQIEISGKRQLNSSWFGQQKLTNQVMMWNSCIVHSEPMKSTLSGQGVIFFAAGDGVNLQAGPSEPVFSAFFRDAVVGDMDMEKTMSKNKGRSKYGWTGTGPFPKTITLTDVSVGGTSVEAGKDSKITWKSNGSQNVTIDLYEGMTKVETIVQSTQNTGSYTWAVPLKIKNGNNYTVKVHSTECENMSSTFAIIGGVAINTIVQTATNSFRVNNLTSKTVNFVVPTTGTYTISIFSVNGQNKVSFTNKFTKGLNNTPLKGISLSNSVYFVSVKGNNKNIISKISLTK